MPLALACTAHHPHFHPPHSREKSVATPRLDPTHLPLTNSDENDSKGN